MLLSAILLTTFLSIPLSYAQQVADGLIVPFTSVLPACASKCGPLFDVQGKCTPPNIPTTDTSCFCSDNRLRALNDGTAGVTSVCTAAACTTDADLQAIQSWFTNFCSTKLTVGTTTTAASTATGTGASSSTGASKPSSGNKDNPWIASHLKWVIMIIVIVVGLAVIWIGAWLLRKRYLRKKEKEIEMRPPVAWGPHQMQTATGGYNYGDGIVDGRGNKGVGGHHKEASQVVATPANTTTLKKKGWFRKG